MAVTVSGVDGDGNRFVQTAYTSEISRSGARLEGIGTLTRIGAKINVKDRGKQAQFCVVWMREAGTSEPSQIGIRSLDPGTSGTCPHLFPQQTITLSPPRWSQCFR